MIALLDDPILDADIQSLAYGAVGKMARQLGPSYHDDFELLEKLFTASHSAPGQVRPYVRDALAMMRAHYVEPSRVVR